MRGYGNFSVDLAGLPPLKAASTPPCVLGVSCGEGTIKCYMLGGHGGHAGPLSGYLKHLMLLTTGGRTHGAAPGGAGDRPEASAPGATGHPRSPPGAPSGVPSHLLRQPSELLAAEASSSRDPPADPLRSQSLKRWSRSGLDRLGVESAGLSLALGSGVVLSRWGGDAPWSPERRTSRLGQPPPTPPPTVKYI